jgi:hypothetical protein
MSISKKGTITTVTGKSLLTGSIGSGNTSTVFNLQPSVFTRLNNITKAYEFYRFTRVKLLIPPHSRYETSGPLNSSAAFGVIGYFPELTSVSSTTAITVTPVSSLQASRPLNFTVVNVATVGGAPAGLVQSVGYTKDVTLTVSREMLLATPTKWFRNSATAVDLETVQGQFIIAVQDAAGENSVTLPIQFSFEIEFTGQVDNTTLTMFQSDPIPNSTERKEIDGYGDMVLVPRSTLNRLPLHT